MVAGMEELLIHLVSQHIVRVAENTPVPQELVF